MPLSAKTRGAEAVVEISGKSVRVIKGALAAVADAVALDPAARTALEAEANEEAAKGVRVIAVARADS